MQEPSSKQMCQHIRTTHKHPFVKDKPAKELKRPLQDITKLSYSFIVEGKTGTPCLLGYQAYQHLKRPRRIKFTKNLVVPAAVEMVARCWISSQQKNWKQHRDHTTIKLVNIRDPISSNHRQIWHTDILFSLRTRQNYSYIKQKQFCQIVGGVCTGKLQEQIPCTTELFLRTAMTSAVLTCFRNIVRHYQNRWHGFHSRNVGIGAERKLIYTTRFGAFEFGCPGWNCMKSSNNII